MKLGRIRTQTEQVRRSQLHRRMDWRTVWQIVERFAKRGISTSVACKWLSISRSRLYELRRRWVKSPVADKVTPDWLCVGREKRSAGLHSEAQEFLKDELRYIREESKFFKGHYNFAVLGEECRKRFGRHFHRNTIRRWAIGEGLYKPDVDSTSKPCIRFEMGAIGLLFQHDSSHHAWLPLTGRKDILIMTIDDHSRKVVGARLVPRDSSWHHLCVVRHTVETYGCPVNYYTDNHAIFLPDTNLYTQFSRALAALKINLKYHRKRHPQAKGKIEKRFDYFQRRIPYLCERYRITSLTQANRILDEAVANYNENHMHAETHEIPDKRWQKALEECRSLLQPIPNGVSLDIVFGLHFTRMIRSDGTISFGGQAWKIPNAPRWYEVTVVLRPPSSARRPHTEIFVLWKGSTLAHFVLPKGQISFNQFGDEM